MYSPQKIKLNALRIMVLVYNGLCLQVGIKDSTSIRKYLGFKFASHFLQKFVQVDSIPLGVPTRFIQRWQWLLFLVIL